MFEEGADTFHSSQEPNLLDLNQSYTSVQQEPNLLNQPQTSVQLVLITKYLQYLGQRVSIYLLFASAECESHFIFCSRHRHNSLFRRRSNSESSNIGRPHHKKGRHKNDNDQVDSTTEHAHTLPRMASNEAKEESKGIQPSDVANQWEEEETLDSVSSSEDVSSTSNSDEESPKIRLKIRRTVSEPVMMRADDVMMTSPTRKPRARTFAERSPTRITEDLEHEDVGVWMPSKDEEVEVLQEGTQAEVLHQDTTEISELMTECSIEEATVVSEGQKSASEGEHFSSFMRIILKLFFQLVEWFSKHDPLSKATSQNGVATSIYGNMTSFSLRL